MQKENNSSSSHNRILFGIIIAIILGFLIGGVAPEIAENFSILGKIFLNLLMMIVVPLVMLSIIVGITNLGDIRKIGTIGRRTVLYYLVTTGLSVFLGIVLVNIIKPGNGLDPGEKQLNLKYKIIENNQNKIKFINGSLKRNNYNDQFVLILTDQKIEGKIKFISKDEIEVKSWEGINDRIKLLTDSNSKVSVQNENGFLKFKERKLKKEGKGIEIVLPLADKIRGKEGRGISDTMKDVIIGDKKSGKEGLIPRNIFNAMKRMDILPLIFFSLIFGAALSVLGEKGDRAIDMISILNDAVMKIIEWIMYFAPIGIFGIISARIGQAGGFKGFIPELFAVGKYSFTVVLGLAIHSFLVLPLILVIIGKRNPLRFVKGIATALLNAFSTASSSATLPLTMEEIEKNNKISNRTASFVLPIGATINMDGTALYEAVAVIFISQVYAIPLGMMEQAIIFVTATLAAIGAAGIPEAGLVTMVIVLKAVGLPIEGIGIILTVDWLLDRFRTTVNVWGDSVGAGVIETLEQNNGN